MINKIKLSLYFPIFIVELLFFKIFNIKNSEKTHQILIKFFSISKGKSNHIINYLLSFSKIKNFSIIENVSQNLNLDQKKINNDLIHDGFSLIKDVLKEKKIISIYNKIILTKGKYISELYNSNEDENVNLENPKAVKFKHNSNEIIRISEIQDLLVSNRVLNIVQNYLGYHPIIDYVDCFWTFRSANDQPDKEAAQYWHFDMDRVKFLKLFIFLKDCEINNGPHFYVSGSHITKNIPQQILDLGYTRLDDKIILNNFKKNKIVCITAKKGSFLFEDTIGFHKGTSVKKNSRLLLMIQYSTNLFGSKSPKLFLDKKFWNKNLLLSYKKYPKLFKNFYIAQNF